MKRKLNKRAIVLLLSLGLLLAATVGTTAAYLMAQTGTVENRFAPSRVACAVAQDGHAAAENGSVDVTQAQNVKIQNIGDAVAYIRVQVVVTWKDANGVVYAQAPTDTDYTLAPDAPVNWFRGSDGFWYYAKAVAPEDYTDTLITSCGLASGVASPEGYQLSVEIVASAIQATVDAVDAWSDAVTVPSDGADLIKS